MTAELTVTNQRVRHLLRRMRTRRSSGGFTLIEMIIAMMAGLVIAGSAFLLARNATTFFRAESEISTAQLGTMIGMTRLQGDLRRAGFQTMDNVQVSKMIDASLCGSFGAWPAGMKELASIQINENDNGDPDSLMFANGRTPDALIIGGMFGTTEQFTIHTMAAGSTGGWDIWLQDDGAMWRTELAAANPLTMLDDIFVAGRFLRIVDSEGHEAYGVISGLNMTGTHPRVSLEPTPTVPTKGADGVCGCTLPCIGNLVNPIVRYRYDIRLVEGVYAAYSGLYASASHSQVASHKGETPVARTELVRVELDADDAEIATSLEVLAEYAVDLKFGITEAQPGGSPDAIPTIVRHPIGAASVYTIGASLTGGGMPERIRAVQIRLSTRSSKRDRDVALSTGGGGLLRFSLGTGLGFARMRTLVADVALPNVGG